MTGWMAGGCGERSGRPADVAYADSALALVAATIDVLDRFGVADADTLRERDEILDRLKITRLATPAPAELALMTGPTDRRSRGSGSS